MGTVHWLTQDYNSAGAALGVVLIVFLLLHIRARILNPSGLPVFNDRKWFEFGYGRATQRYISDPEGLIRSGLEKVCTDLSVQSLP